mmetsp:Transcript_20001/g.35700  ORF Transcript_20001/g.35700 Transcript_20001/m.35700 type:complete len:131 (+) Transcript_20001:246-638(+)|eukprot:CAMPEP_0197520268 /NCGR_PEP_ID=MMETSP1318-20131121/5604_1 /TAXON_ID=552666 /ORGANISM="Partenskyella glossopodia, Strain RCC365" /LENGTH=130 /DNA_ID=CAMNT_0043071741 /DNA_START=226 /DNA_END=618 /DNA_ORIENTATION=-
MGLSMCKPKDGQDIKPDAVADGGRVAGGGEERGPEPTTYASSDTSGGQLDGKGAKSAVMQKTADKAARMSSASAKSNKSHMSTASGFISKAEFEKMTFNAPTNQQGDDDSADDIGFDADDLDDMPDDEDL